MGTAGRWRHIESFEMTKPWIRLRGSVVRAGDVLSPAVGVKEIRARR